VPFTPRSEHELIALDDDALVAHLRDAQAAGDRGQAALALQVLIAGHWDNVKRRVAMRVAREDVDAVASDVIFSAVRNAGGFEGGSVGELQSWLRTITARRIADYHRRAAAEPALVALATAGGGDGDEPGGGVELADRSQEGAVEVRDVVDRVLAGMSELHARAVELHVLAALPAAEVAARLGLGADNVAQIASRFRRRLRTALEGSEAP